MRTNSDKLGLRYVLVEQIVGSSNILAYRLIVGEAQGGHVLVLEGKILKVLDDLGQLGQNEVQGTLLEDQVGIVGDCNNNISLWSSRV